MDVKPSVIVTRPDSMDMDVKPYVIVTRPDSMDRVISVPGVRF